MHPVSVSLSGLMSDESRRQSPVIIITGTPGTGKSTLAHLLSEESPIPLRHINVGEWVKVRQLYEGYDEEWQSYTVDEDKVCLSNSSPSDLI